jgi:hypothetical protein
MNQCMVDSQCQLRELDRAIGCSADGGPGTGLAAIVARPFRSIIVVKLRYDNFVEHSTQLDVLASFLRLRPLSSQYWSLGLRHYGAIAIPPCSR